MVETVSASPLPQATGNGTVAQGLEPGTELKAKVEANLPGGVVRLATPDAKLELRVPAPLPEGGEVTVTVSGSKQQPAILITVGKEQPQQQPSAPATASQGQASQAQPSQAQAQASQVQASKGQTSQAPAQSEAGAPLQPQPSTATAYPRPSPVLAHLGSVSFGQHGSGPDCRQCPDLAANTSSGGASANHRSAGGWRSAASGFRKRCDRSASSADGSIWTNNRRSATSGRGFSAEPGADAACCPVPGFRTCAKCPFGRARAAASRYRATGGHAIFRDLSTGTACASGRVCGRASAVGGGRTCYGRSRTRCVEPVEPDRWTTGFAAGSNCFNGYGRAHTTRNIGEPARSERFRSFTCRCFCSGTTVHAFSRYAGNASAAAFTR